MRIETVEILEYFFQNSAYKKTILKRKVEISHPKTQIIGAPKVGKSSLMHEYIKSLKKNSFLYIDLNDARTSFDPSSLDGFCREKGLEYLIVDNYLYNFKLPDVKNIIISSDIFVEFEGFTPIFLSGLDFEEYISFTKKTTSPEHAFSTYIKDGVLPEIVSLEDSEKIKRLQEIPKLITSDTQEEDVLRFLLRFLGLEVSIHQLFTLYKKEERISKDRFYEIFKRFKSRGIIFGVPIQESGGRTSRLYFYDYGLKNANMIEKDFLKTFSNLVFLELQSRFTKIEANSYGDFVCEYESLFIITPFASETILLEKIKKYKDKITTYKEIKIVSMSLATKLDFANREIEVVPFWEWALSE
ncbi:MAG: hypothetical protein ACLFQJ_07650 [Campylobacterales bacterium]